MSLFSIADNALPLVRLVAFMNVVVSERNWKWLGVVFVTKTVKMMSSLKEQKIFQISANNKNAKITKMNVVVTNSPYVIINLLQHCNKLLFIMKIFIIINFYSLIQ